ncbi:DUF3426 domain-containing protein [Psychrobacter sp. 1U2]|uniref:DUF3426 domain-containing protein n=1 Tax=Psychrobacter sp. 1U2 TaxID=3453577 RepID=UPI003F46DDDB
MNTAFGPDNMTTRIKTQCPSCQVYFDLDAELSELLHRPSTQMRCAHCQHNFLVNEHLVVSANDGSLATTSKPGNSTHSDDNWLEDLLSNHISNPASNHNNDKRTSHAQAQAFDDSAPESTTESMVRLAKPQPSPSNNADKTLSGDYLYQDSAQRHLAQDEEPHLGQYDNEPQSVAMLLWSAGCLVLIFSLFAQYIIFNLNTLIKNPDYAARLEAVCIIAACRLPSADLDAFMISDPTFRASEIKAANAFSDVQATLSNQSAETQLVPSLKVSIYGSEALVGEFVAMPKDYLMARQSQLSANYSQSFMFTIPLTRQQIDRIIIEPIY